MASTVEILKRILISNLANNEEALQIDTSHINETHSEIIGTTETDYTILSVDPGEHIEVTGVQIVVAGNVGPITMDFADGTPVKRLYSSNKTQAIEQGVSIHGSDGGDILFTGDGSTDEIFVVINYKIHED